MLSFKPTFALSSFIKRLFSASSLSAIRVVSSAYLRLLIFLPQRNTQNQCMLNYWDYVNYVFHIWATDQHYRVQTRKVLDNYPIQPYFIIAKETGRKWGLGACTRSCPILCDPMDCSPPGSSVRGTFQVRILEQVSYSRGSSWRKQPLQHLLHWQEDSLPLGQLESQRVKD